MPLRHVTMPLFQQPALLFELEDGDARDKIERRGIPLANKANEALVQFITWKKDIEMSCT